MLDGSEAGERFSLVEHPMSPRALAAPLHRHTREDEYSFVVQGHMGALLGDEPCRILERFGLRMGEQLSGGWRAPVLDGTSDPAVSQLASAPRSWL